MWLSGFQKGLDSEPDSYKWLISSAAKSRSPIFRLTFKQGTLLFSQCSGLVLSLLGSRWVCNRAACSKRKNAYLLFLKLCRDVEHALAQWLPEGRKINISACLKHWQEKHEHKPEQWGENEVINATHLLMGHQCRYVQRNIKHNYISLISHLYLPHIFLSLSVIAI